MKKTFYIFLLIGLLFSCANPVAPSGGEKDVLAPEVLLFQPQNEMINYRGDRIELIFNEYISYSGGSDKLIITPEFPVTPNVKVKGKKILIGLPENLYENTTYTITFLGAIKDYTEGNTIDVLKYVFSTGPYIDSASISGKVVDAFNKKELENVIVGLYLNSDSLDLKKTKPQYLSQTNASGEFIISNVKENTYKIVALEDKNLNFLLDSKNERASLISEAIFVSNSTVLEDNINIFENLSKASIKEYKLLGNNKLYILFSKPIETISLDGDSLSEKDVAYFNRNNDSLFYHWSNSEIKALNFFIELNSETKDTLLIPITKNEIGETLVAKKPSLPLGQNLVIKCPLIITSINQEAIHLKDSLNQDIPFSYSIIKDQLELVLPQKLGEIFFLEIDSAAINYFNGKHNPKKYMTQIDIVDKEVLSSLILSLNTENKGNIIMQLLNSKEVVINQFKINDLSSFIIENLKTASYYLRIYQDNNANEKWDTGSMENKTEAETTLFYSPLIEVKENWDKEMTISF